MTFAEEPYRNMIASSDAGPSAVSVDVVTIDGICAALGRPPDWIRMDVQGLEFDVLAGAERRHPRGGIASPDYRRDASSAVARLRKSIRAKRRIDLPSLDYPSRLLRPTVRCSSRALM